MNGKNVVQNNNHCFWQIAVAPEPFLSVPPAIIKKVFPLLTGSILNSRACNTLETRMNTSFS